MAPSRLTRSRSRDGVLLVDKPAGITSHDVVLLARRATGQARIGHAGTLDPFATGLLVLLLGRATRLLPYMTGDPKEYQATIRFGAETETDDLNGAVTRTAPPPDEHAVRAAIPALTGVVEQLPPAFSAKRVEGKRAYDIARTGESPELRTVSVTVHSWELRGWRENELDATITCAGGTYIRALARDLGRATGSAAHLSALRRTRAGELSVDDAITVNDLRAGEPSLLSPLVVLGGTPVQHLAEPDVLRVRKGLTVDANMPGNRAALVHGDEATLVAFAERRDDQWQPRVVMHDE
jgi:tRNA pseudouridine55 synthase